jgi:hypothetical protein
MSKNISRAWWNRSHKSASRAALAGVLRCGAQATKKLRRESDAMQEIDESRVAAQWVKSWINV